MFDIRVQWLVYAVAALACFWAWDKMFFWISQKDLKAIIRILGAVLLFTPAPLEGDMALEGGLAGYAPAFIVIIFRTFLENNAPILDAVMYMLGALFVGLIVMSVLSLFSFLRARFFPQN